MSLLVFGNFLCSSNFLLYFDINIAISVLVQCLYGVYFSILLLLTYLYHYHYRQHIVGHMFAYSDNFCLLIDVFNHLYLNVQIYVYHFIFHFCLLPPFVIYLLSFLLYFKIFEHFLYSIFIYCYVSTLYNFCFVSFAYLTDWFVDYNKHIECLKICIQCFTTTNGTYRPYQYTDLLFLHLLCDSYLKCYIYVH